MEELFSNNILVIYIIACIAVISYTNFKENQRMFLLYLFTYGTAYFEVFSIKVSILLLIVITFAFLEYLTEDIKKLELIVKLPYKFVDHLFMMFFQYHFLWILLAFTFLHFSRNSNIALMVDTYCGNDILLVFQSLSAILSVIILLWGAQQAISQPFKVRSITEVMRVFERNPIYMFEYRPEMQEKFELLCEFEDKTYFQRTKSYSFVSFEYITCYLRNHYISDIKRFSQALKIKIMTKSSIHFLSRGHSTPEMQLLRTIGIVRGYDKYKIRRKVYEIVYSKIFFSSLKEYHKANTYSDLKYYRHYLLYIYFRTVLTKINRKICSPLSSAFQNESDMSNWSMNGLFVACLGLSFRPVNDYNLALFGDIIAKFDLDPQQIKEMSDNYPQKFPLGDPQKSTF